jgi:hypothetical protein
MAEAQKYNLTDQNGIEVFRTLPEGTKITLINGAVGELIANPQDGGWVEVKFLEHPDPSKVGAEEYVFFNEVRAAE